MSYLMTGDVVTGVACDQCDEPIDDARDAATNARLVAKYLPDNYEHLCAACFDDGAPCMRCSRWALPDNWVEEKGCCEACVDTD